MDRCQNCQSELRPEWKFCIHCGSPVTSSSAIPEHPPGPSTLPPGTPIRRPMPPAAASLAFDDSDSTEQGGSPGVGEPVDPTAPRIAGEPDREPQAEASAPVERPPLSSYFPPDDFEPAPSADDGQHSRRRIDIPLAAGVVLGIAGVALIVYIIVVLSGRN